MKIPIHALALLVLLDSSVTLAAAKKHRHHNKAAAPAAQRALQDEDATPEIAILNFNGTKVALDDCVPCSNIPTEHMLESNITCAAYEHAFTRRCGTEYGWWGRDGNPEHCQYSCWKNGAPYATQGGAPCCERDDGDDDVGGNSIAAPTSTPELTDSPTGIPETDEPTAFPTGAPTILFVEPTESPTPEPTAALPTTFPTVAITPEPSDPIPVSEPTAMPVIDEANADAADDIEESDDEMAAILSEIQTEIAEVQEDINVESTSNGTISTRPAAADDVEEELDLLGSVIDLGVPVTEDSQNATGVDNGGGDIPDVSDEYLKVIAVEELAIVEEVVDELEAEKTGETSMTPTTIETTMHPTTAHPTLISMTTFDIVDGEVVVPKPPLVDATPAAAPVAETTEPDSKEGEPHPYVWLSPTPEPTITFSPTPHHVWLPPTPFPTEEPSSTPSTTPTVTLSEEPSQTPSASPSAHPTPIESSEPSAVHSSVPSPSPSSSPSSEPTMMHSRSPSAHPTPAPTGMPSSKPSASPTTSPSAGPTAEPTSSPSAAPTVTASAGPSEAPSSPPTHSPSEVPRYVCVLDVCVLDVLMQNASREHMHDISLLVYFQIHSLFYVVLLFLRAKLP